MDVRSPLGVRLSKERAIQRDLDQLNLRRSASDLSDPPNSNSLNISPPQTQKTPFKVSSLESSSSVQNAEISPLPPPRPPARHWIPSLESSNSVQNAETSPLPPPRPPARHWVLDSPPKFSSSTLSGSTYSSSIYNSR